MYQILEEITQKQEKNSVGNPKQNSKNLLKLWLKKRSIDGKDA